MDDHAILMELGKIGLKGVARLSRRVDTQRVDLLRNLEEIISPYQHKKFQTTFFNEKGSCYSKFINLINILPTYQRAMDLLHLFYARKGIDPLSHEALEFKSLVYLRYFPGYQLFNNDKMYRA